MKRLIASCLILSVLSSIGTLSFASNLLVDDDYIPEIVETFPEKPTEEEIIEQFKECRVKYQTLISKFKKAIKQRKHIDDNIIKENFGEDFEHISDERMENYCDIIDELSDKFKSVNGGIFEEWLQDIMKAMPEILFFSKEYINYMVPRKQYRNLRAMDRGLNYLFGALRDLQM